MPQDPRQTPPATPDRPPLGVILAGGQGRRMGGCNKAWITWQGRPLIEHAIERLQGQVDGIVISTNTEMDRCARLGFPCVADEHPDYRGPLAGIAAAGAARPGRDLLCVPVDAPRAPYDLGPRLQAARTEHAAPAAMAHDGQRLQPLFLLLGAGLVPALRAAIAEAPLPAGVWLREHGAVTAAFSDCPEVFANLNTPEDLAPP
ncbi:molybdenum cofactor guanylyltransferase MobA [Thioalkalivibrio halophilus]|uniref:Molybdenum cofactor guanylyltransferase n=1 Tax=Thioalkalivibrio halophilus TaxID=252474 RepID=A0A1V3A121_9GAMM|nr:molybdenum cofactor guanylyltransferase MobA [Thioalkalivibrio halophilus]OOC11067.1 molybdenum cofactor guanylyltransferase [Thioalkalivibrio halophilus]